jgi:hypothetical protein
LTDFAPPKAGLGIAIRHHSARPFHPRSRKMAWLFSTARGSGQ